MPTTERKRLIADRKKLLAAKVTGNAGAAGKKV
jgi:hypothetical protein